MYGELFAAFHYNIPSNNRELQRDFKSNPAVVNYNIPSNNRELQRDIHNH